MIRRVAVVCTILAISGCWWESTSQYRPANPVRPTLSPKEIQATTEAASRVDSLGRSILAKNPKIGLRPIFQTIGTQEAEVFHRGSSEIVITQKMVEMCPTNADLAAVLCLEIGKMVAEREALAPKVYSPSNLPPIDPRLPSNVSVSEFRQAELARFEQAQRAEGNGLPDPRELARRYLEGAGYPPASLDRVKTQLRTAGASSRLESQMSGRIIPPAPFNPPASR